MLALALTSFDGPGAVALLDVPEPTPAQGQVVVAIEAAGVGAWDLQTSHGAFVAMGGQAGFPQTLGWDFAGTVAAVGEGVDGWRTGERVLGFTAQPWTGAGAFAPLLAVDAGTLTRLPEGLSSSLAAAFPVSALTADLAVRAAAIASGDRVLVLGAAGGVGSLVTQLAVAAGAEVIASVSASQADAARALGAAHVVDRNGPVAELAAAAGGPVDALIDLVGPAAWRAALPALRPAARFVTTVPAGTPEEALGLSSTAIGVQPNPVRLGELAGLLASGHLSVPVAGVLPLREGGAALGRVESGGLSGKLVLEPTG